MEARRLKLLTIAAYAAFSAFMASQFLLPIPALSGWRLAGATVAPPAIEWSAHGLVTGETLRQVESWFKERVPLRPFWVGLHNQISYSLFREVPPRTSGTQIVNGPGDWLYERQYIETALTPAWWDAERFTTMVTRLKSVQEKLARRGVPLLLIVGPSKVEVYPEHLPPAFLGGRHPDGFTTNFETVRPLLQEAGVTFIDGPTRFAAWKQAGRDHLFARSGTHWSYDAAVDILAELRTWFNAHARRPMPPLQVLDRPVGPPQSSDRDLLHVLNLLVTAPYEHPLPHPQLAPPPAVPAETLPRILWVHDSFGWMLIELIHAAGLAQPGESLYYFKTRYHVPGAQPHATPIEAINWEEELPRFDAVVLVWTEIAFDFESWGFIEALDRALP